ncbi:hypothetical protein L6164_023590 [Bauhinia variegata]|uniref:Uncharacterized protein n=1 Tax=Bauhinia variegata TaxID=167791 RepID=A0ACB9MJ05_BAUVA|nr:hypothetical protein L6164_023590 [Bauhinia variegata]
MVSNSDPDSVHSANLRYRPPHDVLLKPFRRGTVTVAGDTMHAMYPFLGQGGSAGLEDAIVLTRCLVETFHQTGGGQKDVKGIEMALDEYVKQRRMRLVWLTLQIYLTGLLFETSSLIGKFVCRILLAMLFRDPNGHHKYDSGGL